MHRPPPIQSLRYYPAAGGTCLLAIGVTLAWWLHADVERLMMSPEWWPAQPWRLVTSALPHVGVLHLAFNVYWTWTFGSLLEQRYGSLVTLGMFCLLAAGSAAAEFAVFQGGVGLSGVGYGLFGFLWVVSRRQGGFAGAVDRRTIRLFVGWFFLCIFLTWQNITPIANVAHGAGGALGALLGLAVAGRNAERPAATAGLLVALVAAGLGASVARPYVSFDALGSAYQLAARAYDAHERDQTDMAIDLYHRAIDRDPDQAYMWLNLGLALQRQNRDHEACAASEQSLALDPGMEAARSMVVALKGALAIEAQLAGRADEALRLRREALSFRPEDEDLRQALAEAEAQLRRVEQSTDTPTDNAPQPAPAGAEEDPSP